MGKWGLSKYFINLFSLNMLTENNGSNKITLISHIYIPLVLIIFSWNWIYCWSTISLCYFVKNYHISFHSSSWMNRPVKLMYVFQCILNDPNYGPLMDNIKRYPLYTFDKWTSNAMCTLIKIELKLSKSNFYFQPYDFFITVGRQGLVIVLGQFFLEHALQRTNEIIK